LVFHRWRSFQPQPRLPTSIYLQRKARE
jgi:hypothetical protein